MWEILAVALRAARIFPREREIARGSIETIKAGGNGDQAAEIARHRFGKDFQV